MHPATTRREFLQLRVQGLSFARIARQLGVSKPTLIAWSRQSRQEIASRLVEHAQRVEDEITSSAAQQLVDLNRKRAAIRQELISRALREIPTAGLETLYGEIRLRIQNLESCSSPPEEAASPALPIPHSAPVEPIRT